MHRSSTHFISLGRFASSWLAGMLCLPELAFAQASPFMTGATALQTNILAWLTPIAVILVMVLGAMAMANRMSWGWCIAAILGIAQVSSTYGAGDAHTIIENCGNSLILRSSASEGGGTARFASQLIGEREVLRTSVSRTRRLSELVGAVSRSEHLGVELAVLPSQIEQLPDLEGYLKNASDPRWRRVKFRTHGSELRLPLAREVRRSASPEYEP